jgi:hypothetical protein
MGKKDSDIIKRIKELGLKPNDECASCGEKVIDIAKMKMWLIENGVNTKHGWICYGCVECEECEPPATVFFSDDDYPHVVGNFINDTDGDFEVEWHNIDGWRGYYEVKSDKWVKIHDDCILSGTEDSDELKKFDEELQECLKKLGIRYARVFTRMSNVFSMGYDFFVLKKDFKKVEKIIQVLSVVNILKLKYRDDERFSITALTGKTRTSEFAKTDKLLLEAYNKLKSGADFEEVKNEFISKAI